MYVCFFKQKTAYEMRISDWSSDVCSSDLFGGSRYQLEHNIKEGKGGLRDLHTLFWIAKFLYNVDDIATLVQRKVFTAAEVRSFEKAQNFLWTLRCHMHYLSGRADERLTFDMQKQIAPRMGFNPHAGLLDVERFMKRYFLVAKDVGDLTSIFCAAIEADPNRRSRFRLPTLRRRRKVEAEEHTSELQSLMRNSY